MAEAHRIDDDSPGKRGPEAPVAPEKEAEGKRLPEYANREEEALEEGFLQDDLYKFEGKPKVNDGLGFLKEGTALLKYTRRNGIPHFKWVQLSGDNSYVRWFSKKKSSAQSTINIADITHILKGQKTEVFKRSKQPQLEVASFSIIYNNGKDTFDCVAKGQDECTLWVETLQALLKAQKEGKDLSTITEVGVSVSFMDRYKTANRQHLLSSANAKVSLPAYIKKSLSNECDKADKKFSKLTKKKEGLSDDAHKDCKGLDAVLGELSERSKSVRQMCDEKTSEKIARSDVWRLNVDMDCVLEKVEVCLKEIKH